MDERKIIGIGVIGFAILAFITVIWSKSEIENDLTESAEASLQERDLDWASIRMNGRDALILGEPPNDLEAESAVSIVEGVWGVRSVELAASEAGN